MDYACNEYEKYTTVGCEQQCAIWGTQKGCTGPREEESTVNEVYSKYSKHIIIILAVALRVTSI